MDNDTDPSQWNEFDWEIALREGDEYAARYFKLLDRFCDLPGGNELIAEQMERDFEDKLPECDFDCDTCDDRLECELGGFHDWTLGDEPEPTEEGEDDEEPPSAPGESGDPLYYESHPAFNMLRQTAIGWCNVYSAILPAEARAAGLHVLFHIGRALANLSYSIGDGLIEQPAASVAFAKRSLAQLNEAVGLLVQLCADRPRLQNLLGVIRTHLLRSRQAVLEHLQACREKEDVEEDD